MTPTLRRLNDRERYWGLTWPGWIVAAAAAGVPHGAVELSPFGFKATVTIVALLIALLAMVLLGVSGQALSPGRQLQAIARYRRSPKLWTLPARARLARTRARRRPAVPTDDPQHLHVDRSLN